jgi:membrane protease subunit HflC
MSEETSKAANERSSLILRRTLPALVLAFLIWACVAAFFAVDVTEYGVVMRFGRVVRIVDEAGLHLKAPFDRVVRLDRRLLFSRPARSEYLTTDKKNIVVESLAVWRIADPQRFLATLATRAAADERLSDVVSAEIGSVVGRQPASALISADPAASRYQNVVSQVGRRVAGFARTAYGVEIVSVDLRRLSLPELNREHVFDRMKAERGRIAKQNRSAGELEARKIIAEADHEKTRIEAEAAAEAERLRAEGDAEASGTYAAAFGVDPKFYEFLRTLRAYDKFLDDKTTLFLPTEAEVLRILRFDAKPATREPPSSAVGQDGVAAPPQDSGGFSAGVDLLLKKKGEEGLR